jgi:hypothetical protein
MRVAAIERAIVTMRFMTNLLFQGYLLQVPAGAP